ncbi:UxaA family hydrolase [Lachnospira multipara]|uniref:UxaA family hydrolase n=1 Tax=Lachnospira multipara TaxID=28051 RepID=UPI000488041A|nr:altronate dehydratase family protein [Lachnospira multipara]
MQDFIKINKDDNVCVALKPIAKGTTVNVAGENITTVEDIPQGHKFAIKPVKKGDSVIKYGFRIGIAQADVEVGAWIHTHNLKTGLGELLEYKYEPTGQVDKVDEEKAYFDGYVRENGKVGVRNEVWIIPTVGCVNSIARAIEAKARLRKPEGVDEVVAFTHPYGCSQVTEDQENTRTVLADLINHPNAGAVLVLGLGCENSRIEVLKNYIGEYNPERVKFLQVQDVDYEQDDALRILDELMAYASKFKREKVDAKELIIGMKCGGSDGLSGITANPTVGQFSDMLVAKGGTTILTEVPEMFGAETILMNRCENEELFNKTVHLINDFKEYFIKNGQEIYENPSPGNKDGGITTLEDKSLGCTQKSGSSLVKGVLAYGEPVNTKGLNLLSAPGNDLVAATALAASGAQIVLFTTGRGTPFASPVPTVKIATNSKLANKKSNWIDFNCGRIVADDIPMETVSKELFQYVLDVASGKKVKAEEEGFHDFAIFKQGVTL